MKLLNINEDIPDKFYVFLSFTNNIIGQFCEHNYSLNHRLISSGINNYLDEHKREKYISGDIDYLPFVKNNEEYQTNGISSYSLKSIRQYNVEYNLEIYRKINCKKYPSRLSGLYAFGDIETCKKVSELHKWNLSEVKEFKLAPDCLKADGLVKVVKVNMGVVTLLNSLEVETFSPEQQSEICKQYWNGGEISVEMPKSLNTRITINSGCVYEYIIEGILEEIKSLY